jgi:mandelate racemase
MPDKPLTVAAIRARGVVVPMARPLATGAGAVTSAPLMLVDLETKEGVTGRAYIFAFYASLLAALCELTRSLGEGLEGEPLAPLALEAKLQKTLRLPGLQGLAMMALSGIDMAAWDAYAQSLDLPLVRALGAAPRPVPAYNSNGLGIMGPEKAAKEAAELAAPGFKAVKVRLGYPDIEADLAVIRAVRDAVPAGTVLMSDYNQCLSVAEATRRIARLDGLWSDGGGLAWVEEPIRADDYAGCATLRAKARTPIQIGENFWGVNDMEKAVAAGAADLMMPDAARIGGVTGWLRTTGLAAACEIPLSSHLYPEVSAHLLAATPTAHWLEYVDWANPVLKEPLAIADGQATAPERPGAGIKWNEAAVEQYAA